MAILSGSVDGWSRQEEADGRRQGDLQEGERGGWVKYLTVNVCLSYYQILVRLEEGDPSD